MDCCERVDDKNGKISVCLFECFSMDSWDVARLEVALGMHTLRPIDPAALRKKVRRVTRHKGFDSRTLVSTFTVH